MATGTEYDTSPVFQAIQSYYSLKAHWDLSDTSYIFCTYFPTLWEFISLYSTDIRTVYYMGDISDEETVRFLNGCYVPSFQIIKLELE
jgi:hypothetical protein